MGTIDWKKRREEAMAYTAGEDHGDELGREQVPAPSTAPDAPVINPPTVRPAIAGLGVTPVTDKFLADPEFSKFLTEHKLSLKAVETQAQGGDSDTFWSHVKKAYANDKDLLSEIGSDVKGSFLSANHSQELLNLRAKQVLGEASQSEVDRAEYLSARNHPWLTPNKVYNEGFFGEMPGKLAGMAGGMIGDAKNFAKTTSMGAGGGALLGSAFPVVGTTAGAIGGAKIGLGIAMADNMARTAMGQFYETMRHAKTPDGEPVDDNVARGAALLLGGANGLLGALPLAGVLSKSGIAGRFIGPGAAEFLSQYIADPMVAQALSRIAIQFGSGVGAQAVVGGLQSVNDLIAEKVVTQRPVESEDVLERLASGARGGAQLGFAVGGLEVALHRAVAAVTQHENAGRVTQEAFEGQRDAAHNFHDTVAESTGQKMRTLPRYHVEKILAEAGLQDEGLKEVMPSVAEQMAASEGDPNTEIRFTPGEMSAYIAPHPGFQEAKGDLRAGSDARTLNEIKKLLKTVKGDTEEQMPELATKPRETAGQMALRHAAEVSGLKEGHAEEPDTSARTKARQQSELDFLSARQTREKAAPTQANAAVDYASRVLKLEPMFSQADSGNMTPEQVRKYSAELDRAIEGARTDIEKQVLEAIKKEGLQALDKYKAKVRQELIQSDPTHSLASYLEEGSRLDEGPVPLEGEENHKLDTDDLRRMGVSEGELNKLAKYHAKDGLDPRVVARSFGMSAHEMVEALKSHVPLEEAVNNRTSADMPGYVEPSSWLKGRAVDKLSNDVIPKMLETEYQALGGRESYEQVRTAVMNALRYDPVFALDPEHFFREFHRLGEEARKARAAERAAVEQGKTGKGVPVGESAGKEYGKLQEEQQQILAAHPDGNGLSPEETQRLKVITRRMGELEQMHGGSVKRVAEGGAPPAGADNEAGQSALDLKRRQMVAFESWKLARQALEDQSKTRALLSKMANDIDLRKRLPPDGVRAFDSAAEAYGAKPSDNPQAFPIGEYVEKENKKPGADIVEDPELKARALARKDIGSLTVSQLRNAKAFLESLYHHVVVDAPNFSADGKTQDLQTLVGKLVKNITETGVINRNDRGALRNWVSTKARGAAASLIKAEFLIRHLDGGDFHGELARAIWQPLVEAEGREAVMQGEIDKALRSHIDKIYDGSLAGESSLRVATKGFERLPDGTISSNPNKTLSKTELLSAIINVGSARNRKALLDGYGVTFERLLAAAGKDLSAKHLEFANQFWAMHEKYFPEVAATYARRTGTELEAVKPIPFSVTTADGKTTKLTGGYVPIRYGEDAKYINRAYNVQGYQSPDISVNDRMTESRSGTSGAIELNLARVLGSLRAKVHYATTYDAIQNVAKVIQHPDFVNAIKETVGNEFNGTLQDALRHMARDGMPLQPLSTWDKAIRAVQSGASQAHVAWNHITAYVQPIFGISQATGKLGGGVMGRAMMQIMSDWKGSWDSAMEESNVLWTMGENPSAVKIIQPAFQDISVPLTDKMLSLGHGKIFQNVMDVKHFLSELGMAHQQNTRQLAGLVAYHAAKLRALEVNAPDPVAYADAVLRQTIGGTGFKDMPNLLSAPGIARGYVNYYSHRALIASEFLERMMTARSEGFTRDQLLQTSKTLAGWLIVPMVAMAAMRQTYKDAPSDVRHHPAPALVWTGQQLAATTLSDVAPGVGDIAAAAIEPSSKTGHATGGPLGQMTGDVRASTLGLVDHKHKVNYQAMANVASFLAQGPYGGMAKDLDILEGVITGRYPGEKWYDIYARGPKKGRK